MASRHFDPTLNYHENSLAKGIIECLMLKRAKCTLYLIQESDTMGKDSEMAITLAQGKTVIAYIPQKSLQDRETKLKDLGVSDLLRKAYILIHTPRLVEDDKIRLFQDLAEQIAQVQDECKNDPSLLEAKLYEKTETLNHLIGKVAFYEAKLHDKRAKTLKYDHPLRMQMNLKTGVANGVLVCRDPQKCRELIYRVLTNDLEFDIYEPGRAIPGETEADKLNYRLVERITGCVFRMVTKDDMLTNSFWNLYMKKE